MATRRKIDNDEPDHEHNARWDEEITKLYESELAPNGELRQLAETYQCSIQTDLDRAIDAIPAPSPRGRPPMYDPAYDEVVKALHLAGLSLTWICRIFQISLKTYYLWADKHPSFARAIVTGRELADAQIAYSLYHRARGYSHPDVHISSYKGEVTITPYIKHYPPDTQAAIHWLNSRQREKWHSASAQAIALFSNNLDANGQVPNTSQPPQITLNVVKKE